MLRSAAPPSSPRLPADGGSRPAIRRSSDDLPEPLGPTRASASPAANRKLTPENTFLNPRTQPRPVAERQSMSRFRPAGGFATPGGLRKYAHLGARRHFGV